MSNDYTALVSRVWNYAHVLRDQGIGYGESPIRSGDALAVDPGERYSVVLTNPPFGKKSSYRVIGEDGEVDTEREDYEREDFKFTTSNKQLNFLQHIMTVMETGSRAGVVLPDNVLFEAGSAGEGIRRRLLEQFDFHTLRGFPPASSTSLVSKRTFSSSTSTRHAGTVCPTRRRCGSTTCARTSTSHSRRTR